MDFMLYYEQSIYHIFQGTVVFMSICFLAEDGKVVSSILKPKHWSLEEIWDAFGWPIVFWLVFLSTISLILFFKIRKKRRAMRMTTIKGRKEKVDSKQIRTVTLVGQETIELLKGETFLVTIPEREGYDFGGWFYDSACTEPYKTTAIKKDIVLYPKWTKSSW